MFSVFTVFTKKKKSSVNLYQKELLWCFSEDLKMWTSHNVLNWHTNWWLFNVYVDFMDINTKVNSLIFGVRYSFKISENKTAFKIAAFGLQSLCDNGTFYNNSVR